MRAELEAHMDEAETGVFPAVRARAGFGAATAGELVQEHEATGAALARMRGLTGGYDLALALCNAHSATLDGGRELEADVHRHVHEENNILFPRAPGA
jgi:regulator of cell morphogenesis and NO signaling